jgi:sulfite oxidase
MLRATHHVPCHFLHSSSYIHNQYKFHAVVLHNTILFSGKKKLVHNASLLETEHASHNKKGLLPVYTLADVAKHATKDDRIWVTYDDGVYDITDFVDEHPGGDKILMAAGGSLEPFWLLYAVHKNPEVLALLEQFRIGEFT